MRKRTFSTWTIATAGIAAAGLGAVGVAAATTGGDDDSGKAGETITLKDQTSTTAVDAPVEVTAPDRDDASPDGASVDSPHDTADDSVASADHPDSVDSPASVDTP